MILLRTEIIELTKKRTALVALLLIFGHQLCGQNYCSNGPSSDIRGEVRAVDLVGETHTISYTGICPGVTGLNNQTSNEFSDLRRGQSYTLHVTYGNCTYSTNAINSGTTYIDYNGNGLFESNEVIGMLTDTHIDTSGVSASYQFTVPVGADLGLTRMRVIQWQIINNPVPTNPCPTIMQWGSIIDFGIMILDSGICSSAPTPGVVVASDSVVCVNNMVTLNTSGFSFDAGLVLQWEKSLDGLSFSAIPGQNWHTTIQYPNAPTWYRCAYSCSGLTSYSNPLMVNTSGTGLSGIYTLNPNLPSSNSNFTGFSSFLATLSSCGGVLGPVTLLVAPGVYDEQIIINGWAGSSSQNLLTIKKDSSLVGDVIVQYNPTLLLENYVLVIQNVHHLRIEGITIKSPPPHGSYSGLLRFIGSNSNIYLIGNTFMGKPLLSSTINAISISKNQGLLDKLWIVDNTFSDNSTAIGLSASTSGQMDSIFVLNNSINNVSTGISLSYIKYAEVIGNHVQCLFGNGRGISVSGGLVTYTPFSQAIVRLNKVNGNTSGTFEGIYASNLNSSLENRSEIVNNMVYASGASTLRGIYLYNNAYIDIEFNSVQAFGSSATAATSIFIDRSTSTAAFPALSNRIRYNIFTNRGVGYVTSISSNAVNSPQYVTEMNNNLYFTEPTNTTPFRRGTVNYSSLALWQQASNFDSNSIFSDPFFNSATDLHIDSLSPARDFASNINHEFFDFDGDARGCLADIGADEYEASPFIQQNICGPYFSGGILLYEEPGNYIVCDTAATPIYLTISSYYSTSLNVDVCDSYVAPNNQILTQSGFYPIVVPDSFGCDSLFNISLTVRNSTSSNLSALGCGAYVAPDGQILTQSGQYVVVIPNSQGCDSTITLDLTIFQEPRDTLNLEVCEPYVGPDNQLYFQNGQYFFNVPLPNGCDSLLTVNLSVFSAQPEICLVSADSLSGSHNVIFWEKPGDLNLYTQYQILREFSLNQFQIIGVVSADSLAVFHDSTSIPGATWYKYKIALENECGGLFYSQESHSTIHLQYFGNGTFQWSHYLVENASNVISGYEILRDTVGNGDVQPIAQLAATENVFTVTDFNQFSISSYRIRAIFSSQPACVSPGQISYASSYSNLVILDHSSVNENLNQTGNYVVYPNPASSWIRVEKANRNSLSSARVYFTDINGRELSSSTFKQKEDFIEMDVSQFHNGVYFVRIEDQGNVIYQRVVLVK